MSAAGAGPDAEGGGVQVPPGLEDLLASWLPTRRWFAATGRPLSSVQVARASVLGEADDATCLHLLVDARDDVASARYQVLLGLREELPERLESIHIGTLPDGREAYDALFDPPLARLLTDGVAQGLDAGGLRLRREESSPPLERGAATRVLGVEQSNTSLVVGEDSVVKVFRVVRPGLNPDLEVTRALTREGSAHVPALQGWAEADVDGEATTLAMAQAFLRTGSEGWALATTSVRDLMVEADLHADEVGGDFASEADRLGAATATVHAELARALPVQADAGQVLREEASAMRTRLDAAVARVDALREHADALRAAFEGVVEAVRTAGPAATVQRVHGDLHLGQVLRTETGWFLLDFEGEPLKTPAERRAPSSPLRDVAGMLRSFDYCAYSMLLDMPGVPSQLSYRAAEWAERNRSAFCDGYASVAGADPRQSAGLLRAYELDKAVYEVVYEATHRPSWLRIPLLAVARLTS